MKIFEFKDLIIKNINQSTKISLDNLRVVQKADLKGIKSSTGKTYAKFCANNNTGNVKTVVITDRTVSFSIFPSDIDKGIYIDNLLKWAQNNHDYDNKTLCYLNNDSRNIVVEKVNFKKLQGNVIIEFETKI